MIPGLTPSCGNRLTTLPSLLFSVGATVTTTEKKTKKTKKTWVQIFLHLNKSTVEKFLMNLISGDSVSDESSAFDEEVNDTEWFFLVSMAQSFVNDDGLPGQAYFNSTPVWLVGNENLALSRCERARQGQEHGLQTLVCVPSVNGVLELGSTELIYQNNDFMNQVKMFFDFGSSSQVAHQGENVMGTWAT